MRNGREGSGEKREGKSCLSWDRRCMRELVFDASLRYPAASPSALSCCRRTPVVAWTGFRRVSSMEISDELGGVGKVGGRFESDFVGLPLVSGPPDAIEESPVVLEPPIDLAIEYLRDFVLQRPVDFDRRRGIDLPVRDRVGSVRLQE